MLTNTFQEKAPMHSTFRAAAARLRSSLPSAAAGLAAVLAVSGCEPVQVTTTVQPAASPTARQDAAQPGAVTTSPPGAPVAQTATPLAPIAAQSGQLGYLWTSRPPAGMTVQASASRADATSFVLRLTNPSTPGVEMTISGGGAVQRPNARASQAVSVRGQSGSAYTTGAGYTVIWEEGGQPYEIIAFLSLSQVLAAAVGLQSMDLQSWRQRVAAA